MVNRASSRGSFSVESLIEMLLEAVARMLAVAGLTTGGGRPLLPRSIYFRIALKAAARAEIEPNTDRFYLAQAGERIDATAAMLWRIEAPGNPIVTVVEIGDSAQPTIPNRE